MKFCVGIYQPPPSTMADFEPNPGPPKPVANALPPPAPPFHPVQPKSLQLSNTMPPPDHQKDMKSPGTQLYMTSYSMSCLPKTKTDHDPNDRHTNGLHNRLQTAQFKKKCKIDLNLTTRKLDNPWVALDQHQMVSLVECHTNIPMTNGLLHPTCTQLSITIAESTTTRPKTTHVLDEACQIAEDLLKNMQLLERYLHETMQITKPTTDFLQSQEQHHPSSTCTTPISTHQPSTKTDHALMIQTPASLPSITFS